MVNFPSPFLSNQTKLPMVAMWDDGEFYNGFNTLPTTTPEASTDAAGRGWVPQVKWT